MSDSELGLSLMNLERRNFIRKTFKGLLGMGLAFGVIPFIRSCLPSQAAVEKDGPLVVDISALQPGDLMTVLWRGKPVWILRRTSKMLLSIEHPRLNLKDPNSLESEQPLAAKNQYRSIDKEFFIAFGKCTHMGCIPLMRQNAFLCPCHGSSFDLAGRVAKAVPAPRNLDIPNYHFSDDGKTLIIGN
jgi:ubiquinol-cytochrome c reductase iron-sulfur subunit